MKYLDYHKKVRPVLRKLIEQRKIKQIFLGSPLLKLLQISESNLLTREKYEYEQIVNIQTGAKSSEFWMYTDSDVYFSTYSLDAFKAGMAHILHMVQATTDYPWFESNESTKYKIFNFDEGILNFELFDLSIDNNALHTFSVETSYSMNIMHAYDLEDKQLLQSYAPYFRKHIISCVIDEL